MPTNQALHIPNNFRRHGGKKENTRYSARIIFEPLNLYFSRGRQKEHTRLSTTAITLLRTGEDFECGGSQTRRQRGLLCEANKGFGGERKCKMGLRT